ncbi:MAG: MFS transporter [Planctomycetota bacterium]
MNKPSEDSGTDTEPPETGSALLGRAGEAGVKRRRLPDTKGEGGGGDRPAASGLRLPSALRAFRHRNYRLFFGGQFISVTGTWMQMIAQSWLVYRLTGSAVLLGLVGFLGQIPVFLFATLGGTVADRYKRRHIIVITQTTAMLLAFLLAGLTLTGRVQVWHVLVLASCLGVVNAFDAPTRQAFVVDMVGKEDILNAIALNSSLFNSARILGPSMGGIIIAYIGEGWCFFLNAASYLAVIAGLLLMRIEPPARSPVPGKALASILEGFRYVGRTRSIRALLLLLGLVSLTGMPYVVLMPIFVYEILQRGPVEMGWMMGASGIGALTGALVLATRKNVHGLGRWVAIACASFGLCLILFASSRHYWLSAALLLPVGFSMITQMASSNTLIQSIVPDHLRGRVMAVYAMMFMGMAPFGSLLSGILAKHLGAPITVTIGGAACLAGAAAFALRMPTLNYEAPQIIVSLETPAGDPPDEATGAESAMAPR